tara:strand:+ start:79 stop:600 length:522 start_codon:yes stop_codon:yes gene_type:complete
MTRGLFLSIIFLFFQTIFVSAQDKIAFIDLNYIFLNSEAGKNINLQIKDKKNMLDKDVENYKQKIDEQKKTISAQKNVLSKKDFEIKVRELEQNIKDINLSIAKKNKDLSEFKSKVEREFFEQLNKVVENYSLNNSISIILKKENLLMAKKNLDITNDIFKIFNEKVKEINIR